MNTLEKLEWATIVGATVLLFGLGTLAVPVLQALDDPDYYGEPDYVVKVTAEQWAWKFTYPDGSESGELIIKNGDLVRLELAMIFMQLTLSVKRRGLQLAQTD